MKTRIKRIFSGFKANPPDAIFINYGGVRDYSFFHVTGLTGGSFEGSSAIIRKDGSCSALIPQLEENTAIRENKSNRLGLDLQIFKSGMEHIEMLRRELKGVKKLGINYSGMSVATKQRLQSELKTGFVDAGTALRAARLIKDEIEISKIKKAVDIAENAFGSVINEGIIKPGIRERDLAAELVYFIQKNGGTQSFPSIIAIGKNAAEPHYGTGDAKLRRGDFILIDWGAKFQRYCSDLSRTFVFGRASPKQRRMLELVEDAQEVAFNLVQEGVNGAAVHSAVEDFINKSEFKGKFVHATGHSLGLEVHDGAGLGREKIELKEGMVITVEPGIYLKGMGGVRIEDDVLIKKGGIEKLSRKNRFFEL
ncbi:MAG: Xaa-Pro peptidase family protein [Candidatus Micrarchaeota archaeon]